MRYLLILLLFAIPAAASKLYKTVDKDGNVVYTDTPAPDAVAEELKLAPINLTPSIQPPPMDLDTGEPEKAVYKTIEITSPEHDSTVFINQNNLSISVSSIPVVNTGENHALQVLLDDKIISEGSRSSFLLDEVDRGTHTIKAQIIDQNGRILIVSDTVVVHVRKAIYKPPPPSPPLKTN